MNLFGEISDHWGEGWEEGEGGIDNEDMRVWITLGCINQTANLTFFKEIQHTHTKMIRHFEIRPGVKLFLWPMNC